MKSHQPIHNLGQFDQIYNDLLEAYEGLSLDQQQQLSAALLICLCNRIADPEEIRQSIDEARASLCFSNKHNIE